MDMMGDHAMTHISKTTTSKAETFPEEEEGKVLVVRTPPPPPAQLEDVVYGLRGGRETTGKGN